jgi:hypothetical protein
MQGDNIALAQNAHRIFTLFPWDIWTLCIMKKGRVMTATSVRMFMTAMANIKAPCHDEPSSPLGPSNENL